MISIRARNRISSTGLFTLLILACSTPLCAQETGTAVYYSNRYEGRRMANGEVFDQTKLTASHKSYPFGSLVQVTNLANGKSVKVRVTDRPSASSKAAIELTRGAAERLDYVTEGVAQVRLELVEQATLSQEMR